ncbi:diaminopimelate epimerase [Nocardia sp. CDC159]|uniref:Diaminopimelate epimerase n=1 Tax=Nocardia pulmonis TaxID=2951408 RepID=A0A9X2EDB0_9NOCA|nr:MULTISPECIES: diaminopimelate epimerase [Nocardia]MCM6778784.1 diaminopimelate epimerase [Nocardia pulmonis]MCM6791673.1 diaminopimelate epimerase [Nocardia sp. CDC159]
MKFSKYQALGNDYLVVDPADGPTGGLTSDQVRAICDRHYGIGADGVLYGPTTVDAARADYGLRIYNSDGSECEKSGNGLRMFALYLRHRYSVGSGLSIALRDETCAVTFEDERTNRISVALGRGTVIDPNRAVTVGNRALRATVIDVGNPHAVLFLDRVVPADAQTLGRELSQDTSQFPHRTNVQMVQAISRERIGIEIWERGAGYTLASGSSACAAALAAVHHGLTESAVRVDMPGGSLDVSVSGTGELTLTGGCDYIGRGEFAGSPA